MKIVDKDGTVFCVGGDRAQAAILLGDSIVIVIRIDELIDDACCRGLIGVGSVLIGVFGDVSPLLEGIGTFDDFFFEEFVALLILSQLLFLFFGRNKIFIVLVFVFLPIHGLEVTLFGIPFLQVEFSFEFDIVD